MKTMLWWVLECKEIGPWSLKQHGNLVLDCMLGTQSHLMISLLSNSGSFWNIQEVIAVGLVDQCIGIYHQIIHSHMTRCPQSISSQLMSCHNDAWSLVVVEGEPGSLLSSLLLCDPLAAEVRRLLTSLLQMDFCVTCFFVLVSMFLFLCNSFNLCNFLF